MNFETITNSILDWMDQHVVSILVIIAGSFILRSVLTRILCRLIKNTVRRDIYPTERDRKKRIETLNGLVKAVVSVGVWMVAILMIISEAGVNTGPLLASAGIIGIAFGFGAQSLVKDFVSGLFIIIENQYRIGDFIDIVGVSGTVEAITIRTTVLRDMNGFVHHVPNGSIVVTTNQTMDIGKINETLIVGHDTDLEQLEHVINHVGEDLSAMPKFSKSIKEPPHFGGLGGFEKGTVIIKILGETVPGDQWKVRAEFYKLLLKACKKNGLNVPYSQEAINKQATRAKK